MVQRRNASRRLMRRNLGEAFNPATALGPDAGHFGLVGMRERARRNGLAVFWERDGDWNSVRIEVKR